MKNSRCNIKNRRGIIKQVLFTMVFLFSVMLPMAGTNTANAAVNVSTGRTTSSLQAATVTTNTTQQPELSSSSLSVAIGKTTFIELENVTKSVSFKSEDSSIATVDSYGRINGVTEGTTNIYTTYAGKKYSCKVIVYKERISTTSNELTIYKNTNLDVTLKNRKGWEKLTVISSNKAVADIGNITWDGNTAKLPIQIKKAGKVTFTIKRTKSVETYKVTVTVINEQDRPELKATDLYASASESMVEVSMVTSSDEESLGSGFFIGDGMILTNYHVIEDAKSIKVVDYSGKEYKVETIYDYNETFDLAVLGVEGTKAALPICEDGVLAGETVYTIGSPYGYTGTFSKGIIAKASRIIYDVNYIQTTSPISRGNSGGPLINRFGEVIGVNTLTRTDAQNVNFSVNISYLKKLDLTSPKAIDTYLKVK